MGLRLSIDSSESDSNGPSTSTERSPISYSNRRNQNSARATSPNSRNRVNCSQERSRERRSSVTNATSSNGMEHLLRELGHNVSSDGAEVLRLICSYQSGNQRSSHSTTNQPGPSMFENQRRGQSRRRSHRISWFGVEPARSTTRRNRTRSSRNSESARFSPNGQTSSDSDSDGWITAHGTPIPPFLLRHLGESSTQAQQQAENDLLRALRISAARASYNVDRLTQDKGECTICLEDLVEGDVIARLPCLCIYHKKCIDSWFERRAVCPEHPGD